MRIKNDCVSLPRGTLWHIRQCLKWIHPLDLNGLEFIQLLGRMPQSVKGSPAWHKNAEAEGYNILGMYIKRDKDRPAYIKLFIQDIYNVIPVWLHWTPVATLRLALALAHEVGHHLYARQGFIYSPEERNLSKYEETIADRYAFAVLRKMKTRWHYRFGQWLMKRLADRQFALGILDWEARRYTAASQHWYSAWVLDPEREEASQWHRRAQSVVKNL
jgi:hypothetical protein